LVGTLTLIGVSFFRNTGKIPAGLLIEVKGLRGIMPLYDANRSTLTLWNAYLRRRVL
jgi:hypothetical protein